MNSRLRHWLQDPLFLLCLTAALLAFVVQSGELGTADTMTLIIGFGKHAQLQVPNTPTKHFTELSMDGFLLASSFRSYQNVELSSKIRSNALTLWL